MSISALVVGMGFLYLLVSGCATELSFCPMIRRILALCVCVITRHISAFFSTSENSAR